MASLNPINFSILLSLCLGSLFYGFYLITLALYLNAMLTSRRKDERSMWWKSGNVLQPFSFCLLVTVLVLALAASTKAVSNMVSSAYYLAVYTGLDLNHPNVQFVHMWDVFVSLGTAFVAMALTDGILVLRCYIIYGRNWRLVIIPVLTSIAALACFFTAVPLIASWIRDSDADEIPVAMKAVGFAGYIFIVLTNIVTTGMIIYRLRSTQAHIQHPSYTTESSSSPQTTVQSTLNFSRFARVVAESGFLTTTFLIILGLTYLIDWRYVNCVGTVTIQVIGIAFNLIAFRVHEERNRFVSGTDSPSLPNSSLNGTTLSTMQFGGLNSQLGTTPGAQALAAEDARPRDMHEVSGKPDS